MLIWNLVDGLLKIHSIWFKQTWGIKNDKKNILYRFSMKSDTSPLLDKTRFIAILDGVVTWFKIEMFLSTVATGYLHPGFRLLGGYGLHFTVNQVTTSSKIDMNLILSSERLEVVLFIKMIKKLFSELFMVFDTSHLFGSNSMYF